MHLFSRCYDGIRILGLAAKVKKWSSLTDNERVSYPFKNSVERLVQPHLSGHTVKNAL